MFTLIEENDEIAHYQRKLEKAVSGALAQRGKRNIGYPSDTLRNAAIRSDDTHWHHTRAIAQGRPRWLNWFGAFAPKGNLQITVEINIPLEGRDDQVSGFFVRHGRTGQVFLAHSGRVGGGRAGVGKTGFLAYSEQRLIAAESAGRKARRGILVMALDGRHSSVAALLRYVDLIARYKAAVRAGETNTTAFKRKVKRYRDYYEEGRGRRRGQRRGEIDYITRHGEIVSALKAWRDARTLPKGGRIVKDVLIDMGVEVRGILVEVYEAKSSADRASVYTAIGQLLVHGEASASRRVIVLPDKEALDHTLSDALARLKIEVLRFCLETRGVKILSR